jgi:response regulator of citrate/malate metabolism
MQHLVSKTKIMAMTRWHQDLTRMVDYFKYVYEEESKTPEAKAEAQAQLREAEKQYCAERAKLSEDDEILLKALLGRWQRFKETSRIKNLRTGPHETFLTIFENSNFDDSCEISIAEIMADTNYSRRTIGRHIELLIEKSCLAKIGLNKYQIQYAD